MNRKPSDDSPDPIGTTPLKLADELVSIATAAQRLRYRVRSLLPYLPDVRLELTEVLDSLLKSSDQVADLGIAIRSGHLGLVDLIDRPAGRGDRPLLEQIESCPPLRARESDEVVAARLGLPAEPVEPVLERRLAEIAGPAKAELERQAAAFEPPPAEPRNGLVELPPVDPKARRKPTWEWQAFALDPHGTYVSLGGLRASSAIPPRCWRLPAKPSPKLSTSRCAPAS